MTEKFPQQHETPLEEPSVENIEQSSTIEISTNKIREDIIKKIQEIGEILDTIKIDIRSNLLPYQERLEHIRDDLVQLIINMDRKIETDEEKIAKTLEQLSGRAAVLSEQAKDTIKRNVTNTENNERGDEDPIISFRDRVISGFLGQQVEKDVFDKVRKKAIGRIHELKELLGCLETVSHQETEESAKYYVSAIENVHNAHNYREINTALKQINQEDLVNRFYSTYKKKSLLFFSTNKQIGNGSFPFNSEEYNAFFQAQRVMELLAQIESDMERAGYKNLF